MVPSIRSGSARCGAALDAAYFEESRLERNSWLDLIVNDLGPDARAIDAANGSRELLAARDLQHQRVVRLEAGPPTTFHSYSVPLLAPLLVTAILPLSWAVSLVIARRRRDTQIRGYCRRCGYDLRATPDRCPECGVIPSKGAA